MVTDPVMAVTPDRDSAFGRIGTLSTSRQPLITQGNVKPRKCEKSSSTTVMSTSSRGTPDCRISLITLRPPIPAPRMTIFFMFRAPSS
ncbi:Uncharacterised protein [Mycobacteroides abscessus subsp. abscessus]|nr:Uncharacterised protein [Mycobacteroides abscessus subsp. abscessus]